VSLPKPIHCIIITCINAGRSYDFEGNLLDTAHVIAVRLGAIYEFFAVVSLTPPVEAVGAVVMLLATAVAANAFTFVARACSIATCKRFATVSRVCGEAFFNVAYHFSITAIMRPAFSQRAGVDSG
jgi:xanthosine utilization system XapX-like protein